MAGFSPGGKARFGSMADFSTAQALAVADNPAGGVRLLRHVGNSFVNHAVVNIAGHFTTNPVVGFTFAEVTGVALDSGPRVSKKIISMGTRGLTLWKKEAANFLSFGFHLPLETELFDRDPQRHNANDGGLKTAFDARPDDKGPSRKP